MTTTPTAWSDKVVIVNDPAALGPRIAALNDGTFIVTWETQDDIFGKHLNATGSFTAGDFLSGISAGTTLTLGTPIVTQQTDGSVVVNYSFDSGDVTPDPDVYWAGVNADFNSTNIPFGTEKSGFDEVLLDSVAHGETGADDPAGGAIVYSYTGPGDVTNLVLRFTSRIGDQASNQIFIDSSTTRIELNPALASLHTGFVAMAYESFNPSDSSRDVRMKVFSPDGSQVSSDLVVSTANANSAFPDVTELHGGSFVVTWQQAGGLAFRRYFGNGSELDNAPVLIADSANALLPKITPLNDGGFLIAYSKPDGQESDGSADYDLYLQRYDQSGAAIGAPAHVDEAGDQVFGMNIATLSDGRVVMTYSGETGDSTGQTTINYRIFDPREQTINGTSGNDNIVGRLDASEIHGFEGADTLTGIGGADKLFGDSDSDILSGAGGNDILRGGTGSDQIRGGTGEDLLHGGALGDQLTGGGAADTFLFKVITDSQAGMGTQDLITDFKHAQGDIIDVHQIDANTKPGASGNQNFDFIGGDGFSHHAGELRVSHKNGDTFVLADVNGDGNADFTIEITGNKNLVEADFHL